MRLHKPETRGSAWPLHLPHHQDLISTTCHLAPLLGSLGFCFLTKNPWSHTILSFSTHHVMQSHTVLCFIPTSSGSRKNRGDHRYHTAMPSTRKMWSVCKINARWAKTSFSLLGTYFLYATLCKEEKVKEHTFHDVVRIKLVIHKKDLAQCLAHGKHLLAITIIIIHVIEKIIKYIILNKIHENGLLK